MASSDFGCSIFGAFGLSSQGSTAMVAPPGVVITQAACPHQVAVVTPAAAGVAGLATAGLAAPPASGLGSAGLSAASAARAKNIANEMATIGNLRLSMVSVLSKAGF